MNENDRLRRVTFLCSALLDGTLREEEAVELNGLLKGDPCACERYLELTQMHFDLEEAFSKLTEPLSGNFILAFKDQRSGKVPKRFMPPRWIGLVAACVAVGGAVISWYSHQFTATQPTLERDLSNPGGVAVLSRVVDAVWTNGAPHPSEGDVLGANTWTLESGLLQIEFFAGATVIVQGPASFALVSPTHMISHEGRYRTFVPELAKGFTIATPDYLAVDLGTEFALAVGSDGKSEVHVIEGEVRLDRADGRILENLKAGSGLTAEAGVFQERSGGGGDFVNREQILQLAQADSRVRFREWQDSRNTLANDPTTLILFDFESQKPWDRQLKNRGRNAIPGGAIIGAQWAQGRWPGKGALEFKRISDRVRLSVAGEFEALTLAAWIRVEGLDQWLSSILLTDGFEPGEVHWQLSEQGEMVLGISGASPLNATSSVIIGPQDLGRWIHLVTTIDTGKAMVTHYRDGQEVGRQAVSGMGPLRLGEAELGNWQAQGASHPLRNLNGRVDEFMILNRVLSVSEITEMHRTGANR
jgi:Concanavalin A-like lectin/glucanases superfamily/FecR protein